VSLVLGIKDGSESGTSLDKLQDVHGPTAPAPPSHANSNSNSNSNRKDHERPRVSVDITQHWREGSGELARTLEEDMYGTNAAPLSDATIAVKSEYYAAAAADAAAADYSSGRWQQHLPGAEIGADAEIEPYRFDFDALPLPAGMTLPPWQQTPGQSKSQPQPQSMKAGWRRRGAAASGAQGLAERKIFSPLTKVLSPLVTRAQWIIIVRSALIGLVLACAVGGASMAIH